eukprot:9913190-Karenia_brevis.AAC.1
MITTNVDDLLYGCLGEAEPTFQKVLDSFSVSEVGEENSCFCDKEVQQDDDYGIHVACKDNTEKIWSMIIPPHKK